MYKTQKVLDNQGLISITVFSYCKDGRSDRVRTCGIDVPNVARYQLRHTPKCEKYSIFRSISVSGQTCGQTAFYSDFAREYSDEKVSVYKGFRRFLLRNTLGAVSCSQTSRATNCATPRCVKNIEFFKFFRKWSNLWSNHLKWDFCERG